ncbi:threonine synthase [Aquimarina sp. 2201CG5-10]|uniref:threonine synthase n=1 Tax=Aquimarina callyspongiae TaxID=3098150 RepID=UPI002AB4C941|nr:threonine synthase [Aquimarina sp. 2201CG5-10]MDY8135899.1 threonine synthase [Aquimarina sp. 2201CG5-10]
MLKYISNKGGGSPVDFETAILDGFASDGGLYVPETLPKLTVKQLEAWKNLSYLDLAFEILSLFIDRSIISEKELKNLLKEAYSSFEKEEIIPMHQLQSKKNIYIMELFYGPTISFKDVGLAFLVNLVNFFLKRKNEHLSIVVATTGDTGPATAYFTAGKSNMDAWVLYPKGMITEEQERQMTTLPHANIHPVGVSNCPDGGDDLDIVIGKLYANKPFKEKLKLSSVNSINWGRVMMQTVHYFYGYFQVIDKIGETVHMSVPSGGFGNLCAGAIAREMGLPITTLIAANNKNACLHRIFSKGVFSKKEIIETASSAIDILIPYNFWRYLYFSTGKNVEQIKSWIDEFKETGSIQFDDETFESYKKGFLSYSASDEQTLSLLKEIFETENYLLDPHAAVSLTAVNQLESTLEEGKIICLATAHPAKFPNTIKHVLGTKVLPDAAIHNSIEIAKNHCEKVHLCDHSHLEEALIHAMENNWDLTKGKKV